MIHLINPNKKKITVSFNFFLFMSRFFFLFFFFIYSHMYYMYLSTFTLHFQCPLHDETIEIHHFFSLLGRKMHQRYGSNSNSSSISSSGHGVFLGTAREKRDKLLRKAYLNQQRNGIAGGWQPHTPPSPGTSNESFPSEFRYFRHQQNPRTHSVDSISSSTTTTTATIPINEYQMPRTSSQTSLNLHRSSPCPSDMSFSYSNPKYFVRTAVFRPASALKTKSPLHYEQVIVSNFN
jgi:hypothetical protein